MAEQSVTLLPKWSHDLQHSILSLSRLDRQLEWPNLISQMVTSSPSFRGLQKNFSVLAPQNLLPK